MFLCDWPDRVSLLIDDMTAAAAREVATKVGGSPPSAVRPLPPRLVVCELAAEDGPNGEDVIVLRALPHVLEALGDLLEDDDGPPPASKVLHLPRLAYAQCPSTADAPKGGLVQCELKESHAGVHVAGSLEWGNT